MKPQRKALKFLGGVLISSLFFLLVGCQTPTVVTESDQNLGDRAFSKLEYGQPVDLKRAVIIDVRSSFDHSMSRPPRSFQVHASDWSLSGYKGRDLVKKTKELQRLLALKGVDPLVQVVVLGYGLKGKGEEYLMAATLQSLGLQRVQLMTEQEIKSAFVSKDGPGIENLPYWHKPVQRLVDCHNASINKVRGKAHIIVKTASDFFQTSLKPKDKRWPKPLNLRVSSPNSYWSYGVVLHLREQGRLACVLEE